MDDTSSGHEVGETAEKTDKLVDSSEAKNAKLSNQAMDDTISGHEAVEKTDKLVDSSEAKNAELSNQARRSEHTGAMENIPPETRDQIVATLYGHCMGDAIGLLSEFYSKEQAMMVR